jgi:hypothetical protein
MSRSTTARDCEGVHHHWMDTVRWGVRAFPTQQDIYYYDCARAQDRIYPGLKSSLFHTAERVGVSISQSSWARRRRKSDLKVQKRCTATLSRLPPGKRRAGRGDPTNPPASATPYVQPDHPGRGGCWRKGGRGGVTRELTLPEELTAPLAGGAVGTLTKERRRYAGVYPVTVPDGADG